MKSYNFYITLIILALFIFLSEGVSFNIFTFWNMFPLIISLLLYIYAIKKDSSLYGAYGFLIGSMLLSGSVHFAWLFDWEGTKTSSSTAGLIFLFLPGCSLISGIIGLVIGKMIVRKKTIQER